MGHEASRHGIASTVMSSIDSTRANSSMSTNTTAGTATIANANLNGIDHHPANQNTNSFLNSFDNVRQIIRTHPLIDTHAHPLVSCPANYADYPFERTILGAGAQDSPYFNFKMREIEVQAQLAEFYNCGPQWRSYKACETPQNRAASCSYISSVFAGYPGFTFGRRL